MIGDMALAVVAERIKHASDLRRFGEHKLLLAACLLRLALDKNARCSSACRRRTTVMFSADSRISLCEKTEAWSSAP